MRIFISSVFFMIVIFLNFAKSFGSGRVSSTRAPDPKKEKFVSTKYMGKDVELWVDPRGIATRVLKVDFDNNRVNDPRIFKECTFACRIGEIEEKYRVVAYILPDGSLLGARKPNVKARSIIVEPTDTKWFIILQGLRFKVTQDRDSKIPTSITLLPENRHELPLYEHLVLPFKFDIDGHHFFLYKDGRGEIFGAAVDKDAYKQQFYEK